MQLVVFSDSHGNFNALYQLVGKYPGADRFIFLGDGIVEFRFVVATYPEHKFLAVRGNCDFDSNYEAEDILQVGERLCFFTHGHTYDVKSNLNKLVGRAGVLGASVVLFGHTHTSLIQNVDGILLLNPGSVSLPRGGPASYGLITITDEGKVGAEILPL